MAAKTLMIQGTASSVGKSILVTALCRIFKQDGFSVAPFKAQNMALNSFVTKEGGEIGRSQVIQAEAAGIEPSVDMNPVLLKPEADSKCQVIVRGKVKMTISARNYYRHTLRLLEAIESSLSLLRSEYDIVVIEGAGSPAEINLREREIANMRIARLVNTPVLLAGDIDRGGVFASLLGTLELLNDEERNLIKGFIINKFRGDITILKPAIDFLEKRSGKPVLGVLPYFRDIVIAQEDSVYLDDRGEHLESGDVDIAIIHLPRISNYDDFDPLEWEGARVRYITSPNQLGDPDLIIIPGTKSTVSDLMYLWHSGLAEAIIQRAKNVTPVIGICGGYQMLGKSIHDPDKVESTEDSALGLGLLDVATEFTNEKSTTQVRAKVIADCGLLSGSGGLEIVGYEIHMGHTDSRENLGAFHVLETPKGEVNYIDGTTNSDGTVLGTYLHGIFHNASFRKRLLNSLRKKRGLPERTGETDVEKEQQYDKLADIVRRSLNLRLIYQICRLR